MIDLTEITDKVARSYWEKLPGRPPYDTLEPHEKVGLKQGLLSIIAETATLVEEAVREQIAVDCETDATPPWLGAKQTLIVIRKRFARIAREGRQE